MNSNKLIIKLLKTSLRLRCIFYKYWNRFILNVYGVVYGNNLLILNSFYISKHHSATISIGHNFILTSGESFNPLCRNLKGCIVANPNARIIIGNNVGLSSTCIWAHNEIIIGDNVKIGGDCILLDSDAHSLNYLDRRNINLDIKHTKSASITIENDVLIGTRSIILKGVTIGSKSIIGSGSVVTKSIPPNCIAAGNPCKIIKRLS